jgi:hypothetical protein
MVQLSIVRRGQIKLLAVLGHSSAGQVDSAPRQEVTEFLIGNLLIRIRFRKNVLNHLFRRHFRNPGPRRTGTGDGVGKEIFELEESPIRLDVLIGSDSRDCRLVNTDLSGDILKSERLEETRSANKEIPLKFDYGPSRFEKSVFSLNQTVDEITGFA